MGLEVIGSVTIPESELDFTFVRSSGPGGQNVNKVNSKAVLRWNCLGSAAFRPAQKERILDFLKNKLTRDGHLLLSSDQFRDQGRNRLECLEKLRALLIDALKVREERKETRPTKGSVRRKQTQKRNNSLKKSLRRAVDRN